MDKAQLPVKYFAQKNAWVNSDIFTQWFHRHFVPAVHHFQQENGLPCKALLLLDNAPTHPNSDTIISRDSTIKSIFLPPNTTSLIQPLDQGVLVALKKRYRKLLLRKLLMVEAETPMLTFLKSIDMKDAVYMAAMAWDDIPSSTLRKSWCKLLGESEPELSSEHNSLQTDIEEFQEAFRELDHDISQEEVAEWLNSDQNDQGYQLLSDSEIMQQVTGSGNELESDEDEDCVTEVGGGPSNSQAAEMLEKCLTWYEKQPEVSSTSLLHLRRIRDLAATKRYSNLKQLTIDSFFFH